MTKAAAKPVARKRAAPARVKPERAVPAPTATATEAIRDARGVASSPERVARLHDERLVFDAVMQCRPGTASGPGSGLWQAREKGGIGIEGVHAAARLYLLEFQSAAKVRVRVGLPETKSRAMDRLLFNIQEKHSLLLEKDYDERQKAEQFSPVNGDVGAKADAVLESAFDQMLPVVKRLKWDECEASERNNLMRFFEIAADAKKISTDARHKEAQTERLERMLRGLETEAKRKGRDSVDLSDFRAVVDEVFGLGGPVPAKAGAA